MCSPMAPSPNSSAPPPRTGPRPLPLHVTIAATTWLSCAAALPFSKKGSPPGPLRLPGLDWHPTLRERAASLASELASHPEPAFREALGREIKRRLADFHDGLTRYRKHPWRRDLAWPACVWQEGTTRVYDYAPDAPASARALLLVPSLVNRAYVLDLEADNSFARFLAARGFRPFLVDWDAPGDVERGFGLSSYVDGRLADALGAVERAGGKMPTAVGYCMGGNLVLGLAARHHARLSGLALLATPWDFHADRPDLALGIGDAMRPWWPWIDAAGELPVDVLQGLFAALDPFLAARKFRGIAGMDADNPRLRAFVALEDWLNDGVPLSAPVARETMVGWYGENLPANGRWTLSGRAVRPEAIDLPAFCVIPAQDRIVPPASARALAAKLKRVETIEPALGHIGMVVGTRGRAELWEPLAAWLARLPGKRGHA
jgi:polyhydroxyalkanoate synthase